MSSGLPWAGTTSSSSGWASRSCLAPESPSSCSSSGHSSRASTTGGVHLGLGVEEAIATAGRDPSRRQERSSAATVRDPRSEEHTSELQSPCNLVCRLLLEKKTDTHKMIVCLLGTILGVTARGLPVK